MYEKCKAEKLMVMIFLYLRFRLFAVHINRAVPEPPPPPSPRQLISVLLLLDFLRVLIYFLATFMNDCRFLTTELFSCILLSQLKRILRVKICCVVSMDEGLFRYKSSLVKAFLNASQLI